MKLAIKGYNTIMKFSLTILIPFLLTSFVTPAYGETIIKNGDSNIHVTVNNSYNSGNSGSYTNQVNNKTNINVSENGGKTKVQINNNDFIITGTVKSISGSILNVSGQEINFDSNKLSPPSLGQKVTVKGTVATNGSLTATSISADNNSNSILGTANSQNTSSSPKPTTSPSTSPIPTISPFVNPPTNPKPFIVLEKLKEIFDKLFSKFKIF